jgi:hypothetical protein
MVQSINTYRLGDLELEIGQYSRQWWNYKGETKTIECSWVDKSIECLWVDKSINLKDLNRCMRFIKWKDRLGITATDVQRIEQTQLSYVCQFEGRRTNVSNYLDIARLIGDKILLHIGVGVGDVGDGGGDGGGDAVIVIKCI